jgi:hypothetical protein
LRFLPFSRTRVDRFTQCFAWFEVRNPFFRDLNALTRAGVTAYAGGAAVDGEAAKTTNFDPVSFDQRMAHGIEDRFDGELGVSACELRKASGQFVNEVRAGHETGLEKGSKKIPFRVVRRSAPHNSEKGLPQINNAYQLLSNLARNKAPKLVVPAFSREDC